MPTETSPGLEGALGSSTKTLLVFFPLLNSSTLTVTAGGSHLQLLNQPGHDGKPR